MAHVPWDQREVLAQNPAYSSGMYLEGLTYIELNGWSEHPAGY